jgi:hypothetical protein
MRVRRLLMASMVVTVGVFAGASGTAAASTVPGAIAMYSDTGDYIGQGNQELFAGPLTVTGNAGDVSIQFSDSSGANWSMEFAAPPGQMLQPGAYDQAGRASFRGSGQPGIDINGDGRGCDTDSGRFEVKDIAVDSTGVVDRLWLVFEQHCEGAQPALFGEVRLGEPAAPGAITAYPSVVRWPANNHGTPETAVPVRFVASSPVRVSSVSLDGDNPSDFVIRSDDCTGQVLAPGGFCDVWVRSTPSVPGLRTASLVVHDATGNAYTVPLQSWTYGGTTRLVMSSDQGDWVGDGQQWSFDPTNAILEVAGTPEKVSFTIASDDWSGDFAASQGDILTTGSTWTGAQRYPFNGTSPGLDVFGEGRGCNTLTGQFNVVEATYNADGSVRTFGVQFVQHCEGAQPALHGEFDWRVGDNTPLAPWMSPTGFTASSGGGSPSGSTSNAQAATMPTTTSAGSSSAGNASSSGSPATKTGSPTTAQLLTQTVLRLRSDAIRVNSALLQFRQHPASPRRRRAAASALSGLRQDVATLARLLRRARPAGGAALKSWRRVETESSGWQQALLAEQRALQSARTPASRIWSLDTRARADGVTALKALAKLAQPA